MKIILFFYNKIFFLTTFGDMRASCVSDLEGYYKMFL